MYSIITGCTYKPNKLFTNNCDYIYNKEMNKNVYTKVDSLPKFPSGDSGFIKFFLTNFNKPNQETIQGRIVLELIIDEKGNIIQSKIRDKNESEYTLLEKEALRVLIFSPLWIPAKCHNKNVIARTYRPLIF